VTLKLKELASDAAGESSEVISTRVERARKFKLPKTY
jgi:hypothetical protein